MQFEKRQRSKKARDWTGVVLSHGVVLEELGMHNTHSYWKVKCSHCGGEHSLTVKQMDADVWSRQCPAFRSHNSKGFKNRRDCELHRKYKISLDEYKSLRDRQGGKCAICGAHHADLGKSLHVDHCHTTGAVRGLLCSNCNRALGYFHDSVTKLNGAIRYLETATAR